MGRPGGGTWLVIGAEGSRWLASADRRWWPERDLPRSEHGQPSDPGQPARQPARRLVARWVRSRSRVCARARCRLLLQLHRGMPDVPGEVTLRCADGTAVNHRLTSTAAALRHAHRSFEKQHFSRGGPSFSTLDLIGQICWLPVSHWQWDAPRRSLRRMAQVGAAVGRPRWCRRSPMPDA